VQLVAVADPDGTVWTKCSVRNVWLHPQCEQAFNVTKIAPCPETCRVCGRGGKMEHATYVGAGGRPSQCTWNASTHFLSNSTMTAAKKRATNMVGGARVRNKEDVQ
jgi:hypothetical protein